MTNYRLRITLFLLILLSSSCVSQKTLRSDYKKAWNFGDYDTAYKLAASGAERSSINELYYLLHAGSAQMAMNDALASNETFDRAERIINDYEATLLGSTLNSTGTLLFGESSKAYRPESYDSVMLNVYKSMNYMSLGDSEKAIVEGIRSFERQEQTARMKSREIEATKQAIAEDEGAMSGVNYNSALNNIQNEGYNNWMNHWEAYPDFVSPIATYLQGLNLFLYGDGSDLEKASHLFQRSLSMNHGHSAYILEDYTFAERVLDMQSKRESLEETVWVLFENGTSATKVERKYQVPIPFGGHHSEIHIIPIAVPVMEPGGQAFNFISAKSDDNFYQSEIISDMDRVIYTEFKASYPSVLLRALVNSTAKLILQRQMSRKAGGVGLVASMVYSQLSTNADTRMWLSLPKDFQLIRMPKPENHKLELYGENSVRIATVTLNERGHSVVRVKIASRGASPIVTLLTPNK